MADFDASADSPTGFALEAGPFFCGDGKYQMKRRLHGTRTLGGSGAFAAARGGGPAAPTLHLTTALSKESLTFAFRMSSNVSMTAFIARSPTIFMRTPKARAASFRTGSAPSSSKPANPSDRPLICGGVGGTFVVDIQR